MRDFLDNLIDRHVDAALQIKPRLPSIFEPEVSHGGLDVAVPASEEKPSVKAVPNESVFSLSPRETPTLLPLSQGGSLDVAVPDNNAPEMEETNVLPSAQVTIPTASPTAIEPVQQIATPALTVLASEEKPSVKVVPNESVFSLSPRETPTLPPLSQGGSEEGVKETNSSNNPLTLTLSQRERGINERFAKPSSTPIAPVTGKVRHAHQQKPTEHTFPNSHAMAEEQPSIEEGLTKPVFSLSPRKTSTLPPPSQGGGEEGVREANSTSNPFTLTTPRRERGLSQGLLKPSATLIAPVIPSAAGSQKPISQPEPVINVTIGRIEVRATPAFAPQPQKTLSAPPVMTLDEYLRQRSHGDRR